MSYKLKHNSTQSESPLHVRGNWWRVSLMLILVLLSTSAVVWSLYHIYQPQSVSFTEGALLALSSILFAWLSLAFWTGVVGFVLSLLRVDPLSLTRAKQTAQTRALKSRHAIVMPIYNEPTARTMAGFENIVREMMRTVHFANVDFFLLSDTRDEALANAELQGFQRLQRRLGRASRHVFYRRREHNTERKVGNLKDFCQRWGARYEAMLVLDADSIMSGQAMTQLLATLEANPDAALVQTVPYPVRQTTHFGRLIQFAAHLYSPMLATGLSFWQTNNANYWGHNAAIRIAPFMHHCGLPEVPGKAPFGGEILSHDFVEAALLKRAGWKCYLLTDVAQSYEETPANLFDYAVRDRRWMQGNVQHLRLLGVKGLSVVSRLHFVFGAMAYLAASLLSLLLLLGTIDGVSKAQQEPVYFSQAHQLFPEWQIARPDLMQATLLVTLCMLLAPKILGIIVALVQRRKAFGGAWRLIVSSAFEMVVAMIIAPLMMCYHTYFAYSLLTGHSVRWDAQNRDSDTIPLVTALWHSRWLLLVSVAWIALTLYFAPGLSIWLIPLWAGLLCAPLVLHVTSRTSRKGKLLAIGEELCEPVTLSRLSNLVGAYAQPATGTTSQSIKLPATVWQPMATQNLFGNNSVEVGEQVSHQAQ